MLEYLLTGFLIVVTLIVALGVAHRLTVPPVQAIFLFVWHFAFCVVYHEMSLRTPADAVMYYEVGSRGDNPFNIGTDFIIWYTDILSNGLYFSYFDMFVLSNLIGYIGIIIFYSMVIEFRRLNGMLGLPYVAIILLPGMSYWSCSLGKDGTAFTAALLATYASLDLRNRWLFFAVGAVMMFLVRPQTAALMGVAAGLAVLLAREIGMRTKLVSLAVILVAAVIALPLVLNYTGLAEVLERGDLSDALEERQGYNQEGGGAIDIRNLSIPEQVFAYFFRPIFLDVSDAMGLVASMENAILLMIVLVSTKNLWRHSFRGKSFFVSYNFLFFLVGGIASAMVTANSGIALRQKWMFLPGFLLVCILINLVEARAARLRRGAVSPRTPPAPYARPPS